LLAGQYGRYGYRRITALLQRAGWQVGKDRVERIWRREGLKVPQKQKARAACGSTMDRACGSGRSTETMCGVMTSSAPRRMTVARRGC
jgi:transposase InsO family protein